MVFGSDRRERREGSRSTTGTSACGTFTRPMGAAAIVGKVEHGSIRLSTPATWKDGQLVLVIPLTALPSASAGPPPELLEEDAAEFSPRRDALDAANEDDLR